MTAPTPSELAARWPPEQSHPVDSVAADAWDEGYRAALRHVLLVARDGPMPSAVNPYRRRPGADVDLTGSWPVWAGDDE